MSNSSLLPDTRLPISNILSALPGGFPATPTSPGPTGPSSGTTQFSLSQAVHARRAEYVKPKSIRLKVGSWNTAASKGAEIDLGGWFVKGKGYSADLSGLSIAESDVAGETPKNDLPAVESQESVDHQEARYKDGKSTLPNDDPGVFSAEDGFGLYLLALQEVVDVGSASEAFRPFTDPEPSARWKASVEAALPQGYVLIAEQQLIGLLLLIYASPDVAPDIKSVSTTSVGTGLMGYMGNKGAVTARLVLGETTRLVFVNCHLAAGADKAALERRNWDYSQIISRTKFEPIRDSMDLWQSSGETIDDADIAIWAGDLNYRLADIPGDDVRRLLLLHTRDEYDVSKAARKKIDKTLAAEAAESNKGRSSIDDNGSIHSTTSAASKARSGSVSSISSQSIEHEELDPDSDPASLQTTIASLLRYDELAQQVKARKAFFDGWKEGNITFLPTYKYDLGSVGVFDTSDKKRAPSWCDRIIYRTRRDKLAFESRLVEELEAKKRDADMKKHGISDAAKDEELLYDYDPDEDGQEDEPGYDDTPIAEKPPGILITKEGFEDEITLEQYASHQRVLSSDHKPLDAVFHLKYNYIVPELKAKVSQQVARELDKAENEGRASVTVIVDKHNPSDTELNDDDSVNFEGVNFGHVRYSTNKHRSLTIANTGQVPASVTFIDRPVGDGQIPGPSPSWLRIDVDPDNQTSLKHSTGPRTIEPGEVCNVDLKLRVRDRGVVNDLNEGVKQLDDILVLRVEGGRDHFIPVRGKWIETSLGRSIDRLIRLPERGIRELQNQRPRGTSDSSTKDMPVKWSAPRELFRLTDNCERLAELAIADVEMTVSNDGAAPPPWTTHSGWPFADESWTATSTEDRHELSGAVCHALDNDLPFEATFPEGTTKLAMVETVACFLVEYLENMPDGVVPASIWTKLEELQKKHDADKKTVSLELRRTAFQEILSESSPHSISFILIISMLDRIISEQVASTIRSTTKDRDPAAFAVPPTLKRTGSSLTKREISKEPQLAYRQIVTRRLAEIFAAAMIRTPAVGKKSEARALAESETRFVELFLAKDEP